MAMGYSEGGALSGGGGGIGTSGGGSADGGGGNKFSVTNRTVIRLRFPAQSIARTRRRFRPGCSEVLKTEGQLRSVGLLIEQMNRKRDFAVTRSTEVNV